jgi:DNA-directed RNA polymerase specialized sigma24 family protein
MSTTTAPPDIEPQTTAPISVEALAERWSKDPKAPQETLAAIQKLARKLGIKRTERLRAEDVALLKDHLHAAIYRREALRFKGGGAILDLDDLIGIANIGGHGGRLKAEAQGKTEREVFGYATTAARNKIIDEYRKVKRKPAYSREEAEEGEATDDRERETEATEDGEPEEAEQEQDPEEQDTSAANSTADPDDFSEYIHDRASYDQARGNNPAWDKGVGESSRQFTGAYRAIGAVSRTLAIPEHLISFKSKQKLSAASAGKARDNDDRETAAELGLSTVREWLDKLDEKARNQVAYALKKDRKLAADAKLLAEIQCYRDKVWAAALKSCLENRPPAAAESFDDFKRRIAAECFAARLACWNVPTVPPRPGYAIAPPERTLLEEPAEWSELRLRLPPGLTQTVKTLLAVR